MYLVVAKNIDNNFREENRALGSIIIVVVALMPSKFPPVPVQSTRLLLSWGVSVSWLSFPVLLCGNLLSAAQCRRTRKSVTLDQFHLKFNFYKELDKIQTRNMKLANTTEAGRAHTAHSGPAPAIQSPVSTHNQLKLEMKSSAGWCLWCLHNCLLFSGQMLLSSWRLCFLAISEGGCRSGG